jgi:CRISPR system Cascade subunit CasA
MDYLTWQSRRIHLFESQMGVSSCQIQQGLKLPKQMYYDPFKSFRKDKDKGLLPRNISPEKAVWRDSHILLQTSDIEYKRPEVFNWLARIDESRRFGAIQAASVLLWRHERLPLPLQYLQDENLIIKLKEALKLAEDTGKLLGQELIEIEITDKKGSKKNIKVKSPFRVLAQELILKDQNGKTDPNAETALAESLSPKSSYWAALGIVFNRFIIELAEDKSEERVDSLRGWAEEIRKAASDAFKETTGSLDRTGRTLRAVSKAENEFLNRLYSILKPYINET